jgi:DNA-binding GntR family transcriptional regulator
MYAADKKFHQAIWDLSKNPYLIRVLTHLLMPYFAYLATRAYYSHADDLSYVPRVHQEILDALYSADGERARDVMVEVLNRSMKRVLA